MSMKALIHKAGKLAALFIGAVAVGYAALIAVYALPVEPIREHVRASLVTFDGTDGAGEERNENLARGYAQTWLDNTSDSFMLLIASQPSDKPAYQSALSNEYASVGGNPMNALLHMDGEAETRSYARYWHGYLVFLKPLLTVCTYMDIRIVNMLAQGALLMLVFMGLARRGLTGVVPAFAAGLAALTPWIVPFSMQNSTVYTLALALMCALLYGFGWIKRRLGLAGFFLLAGMATSYFDFLTYPLVAFGFPFLLWTRLEPARDARGAMAALCAAGLAWLAGWAGMWLCKLALGALAAGLPTFRTAFSAMAVRASAQGFTRLDAILKNLRSFSLKPYKLLLLAALAALVVARARRGRRRGAWTGYGLTVCLLVAALPVLWYAALGNHSHIHYYFTHRNLAVSAFALALAGCDWARLAQAAQAPARVTDKEARS